MTPPAARVLERPGAAPPVGEPGNGRRSWPGCPWLSRGAQGHAAVAVIRREWVAVALGGSAVFALITALTSFNAPERVWGAFAAVSYSVSAITAAVVRRRGVSLAVLISLTGSLAAPLAWMAYTGMARIWFGVAFAATFGAAVRIAGVPRPVWWTLLVTASPVVALPLAVGGDDLPVLGLMCLGLALASRASRGNWPWVAAAGLAIGLAAAMKATAWPAVPVLAVLFAARRGWRAVAWFGTAVVGAGLVTDGITVAAHPAAAVANTVLYPLGLAKAASPAGSMLPGHLLAGVGTWGHWAALALMALAGAGVGISLIIRPPRDAHGATWRLALGLALVFVLAPASRVGYFVYPLGLAAWLLLSRWPELPGDLSADPEPEHRRLTAPGAIGTLTAKVASLERHLAG